ncbi:hypothetical protein BURK1_01835 [Burkholderiales bacterium]|nr:hypothetical protein BURK1_01835 [Burkholderiales bacterium]
MPVAPESAASAAATRSRAARLVGLAGTLLASAVVLVCVSLLVVRYVLLPRVEAYRPEIAERLTQVLGAPVAIEGLSTGWDGWSPKLVVTGLTVRDRAGTDGRPLLELPRVEATISWLSLPLRDLHLKELAIERPQLALTRDAAGRIHVAGLSFDPESTVDDTRLVDWLLRQREIVVRDALILWNDERRRAPQLVLDRVQFRLEHPIGTRRHRFGLTGVPPPEVASPIDVRGEFTGLATHDLAQMQARVYLRLDYADLAAWAGWIPLPVEVSDGRGALRLWAELAGGVVRDMTADVELVDVSTRLAPSLPNLELASVSGRVTWLGDNASRRFTTRDLALVTGHRVPIAPVDLALEGVVGDDGRFRSGRMSANVLELAPLASLAASLPMPERWRDVLARHLPRGTLRDARYRWEGPVDGPTSYAAEAEAIELGIAAAGDVPGMSGLSAKVTADERGGSAKVGSKSVTIALPRLLAAPIALDTMTGTVRWRRGSEGDSIEVDGLAFANADAAGTAQGSWRPAKSGPGSVDLTARLTRADARGLQRYLPLALDPAVRGWITRGVTAGTSDDVRLTLKGDLAQFPYADPKQGTLLIVARARGGAIDYVEGWPAISDIDAELRIDRTKLVVDATRGRVYGAQIGRTRVEIDDLSASVPKLTVDGEASGPTAEFVHFIQTSPVAGWIGHALDGTQVAGNGKLALRLGIPLGAVDRSTVAGEYTMAANQWRAPGVPLLSQVDGRITFGDRGVSATDLAAEVFGGPAKLSIAAIEGGVRVTGQGSVNLAALRNDLPDAIASRVSGTTDWTLAMESRAGRVQWTIDSSLRGAAVDMPAPAGKTAVDSVPLRIERRPGPLGAADAFVVDVARVGRVHVHRQVGGKEPTVDRALVLLGRAATQPAENDRAGVWIRGDLPSLNLDDWLAFRKQARARSAAAAPADGLAIRGIDIDAAVFEAFGRKLNDVKATARSTGEDWRIQLVAREAAGALTWRAATPEHPNGRLVGRLARMSVPDEGELAPWQGAEAGKGAREEGVANPWPELDVQSDALLSKGRDLGRLEMIAKPQASDWRIEKLVLASDAGRVQAEGWWRAAGRAQQTRLEVGLEAPEAGAMLRRFGFPDAVRAAPTTIKGQLDWPGAPSEFDPAMLSGMLKIEVGAGQFTKIEPGIGKLLGVLSLQALPRRLSLDFRDVFSEGFAFDHIEGNLRIVRGVMTADDLKLAGPAARVDISGEADLAKETQTLNVRVLPSLSTSFSAGTAGAAMLLLAANPLVAAALGAGALLAQKAMKDPIEQMFSYDYRVTGSWSDPVVARVGTRPLGPVPAPPAGSAAPAAPASPATSEPAHPAAPAEKAK